MGKSCPLSILREKGRIFTVDKVFVRMAASLKAGGQGMRYTSEFTAKRFTCSATKDYGL